MYYNPDIKQTLSDQDLKNLLNVSFPEGREQVQEWLLVHDNVPDPEEGKISVKTGIKMQDGISMQTYIREDVSIDEEGFEDNSSEELFSRLEQITERFAIIDGAIKDLAEMISNLHAFCSNAVQRMEEKLKIKFHFYKNIVFNC